MGKETGFLLYDRQDPPKRPVDERVRDYREIEQPLPVHQLERQATRCMDCGIPFCHAYGCPVQNLIPDWNNMIYRKQWKRALDLLHATNNLPEITGRICPAPCETACTLGVNQPAVSIKQIELQIVERGWERGWIQPEPPPAESGKRVAVVGSGPTGLAAAQQLRRAGHQVVVFERADRIGGILRYGIPDFKLEKWVIDRRLEQMKAEGVVFETGVDAGADLSVRYLRRTFDAVLIAAGARQPRGLDVPGHDLDGVHFAMTFLTQQNRRNADPAGRTHATQTRHPTSRSSPRRQRDSRPRSGDEAITAEGKHVVVIGGGDTGSDCVGTSRRQGAKSITQIELLPQPPDERAIDNPWPTWPRILRTSTSHQEGCERLWSILTKECVDNGQGCVGKLRAVKLDWGEPDENGRAAFTERPGSDFELPADLVLLALGFLRVEYGPLVTDLDLATGPRGDIVVDASHMTSTPGVFAAGDSVLGASLVVRAIALGREAAAAIDLYLRQP
ncbi:MAG: glutamate synthase subunit beta [Candidatus Brocadiae bacterium]|nr:glutamate synthase subunit beta [Candidatus Brocadiia bacterium]